MFTDVVAAATLLGLFITLATWINGRTVKHVVREEAKKTGDTFVTTLVEEGEKTRAILQAVLTEVR